MRDKLIIDYIEYWKDRGYPDGIPDEVPDELMNLRIAPSYKAICMCVLANDLKFYGLGFSRPKSKWYGILKRIEIESR